MGNPQGDRSENEQKRWLEKKDFAVITNFSSTTSCLFYRTDLYGMV
jgi:hypothetical protein